MPFNEVENFARILKVKRALEQRQDSAMMIAELEKVMYDMADDYGDRTDECLLVLAQKHISKG